MQKILVLLAALLLLLTPAMAVDVAAQQTEQFGLGGLQDALPSGAADLMEGITPLDPGSLTDGLGQIAAGVATQAGPAFMAALRTAIAMMAVVMLCAMTTQLESKLSQTAVLLAGTLAITLLSVTGINSMVGLGKLVLDQLQSFTALLLPVLATATVASGAPASSGVIYVASVFVSNFLITMMNRFLVPLVYAFLAVAAADTALGNQTLQKLRQLLKWIITNALKAVVLLFTGFMTVSGIISGASDELAIKAAKLAVSTIVPVVGGMISDASETVLVSARMIKSTAGLFGMLAVIAICLLPLIKLGFQFLTLKVTAAVSAPVGDKRLTELIDHVSDAMGFLMGMTGACGLMLLISCVCSIKAVSG